ncbi:PREDICTED: activating signal cointegrator 1 [Fragaria vesca subsp. vesca]|uniref:activating signal cointegrator 1 n=1 Tax=Fragaria vesca subsp. vesca TaxID=101020 RepID=UPI0002C34E61|nr:PREDICTED: activating signal cointegrator 1 [Fragaria vesca subsp. vesca]
MGQSGQWLEKALVDLCQKMESGLGLDQDMISGLVSYCELADPRDAKEYLDNIIGQKVGKSVIEEYLQKRGRSDLCSGTPNVPTSSLQAYVKASSSEYTVSGTKKQLKMPKVAKVPSQQAASTPSSSKGKPVPPQASESRTTNNANQSNSKKKKAGKVVSLAEAAKGSIVFQQGKPCSCQARRHGLVSNCLSCGKIVCEQEGEGPCNFCGALVLKEGSSYAGLDESYTPVVSDAEAAAEAYAKRLVEYDRDSAARTTVIDDQSDYFEIEGNSWLSKEEKKLLKEKQEQIEEAERAKRNRVVVTFDLFGRKVLFNEEELAELESESLTLKPLDEREVNRIKPNPDLKVRPLFVDPGPRNKPVVKGRKENKNPTKGLCLEITGRVQHVNNDLKDLMTDDQLETTSNDNFSQGPSVSGGVLDDDDGGKCSLDYR